MSDRIEKPLQSRLDELLNETWRITIVAVAVTLCFALVRSLYIGWQDANFFAVGVLLAMVILLPLFRRLTYFTRAILLLVGYCTVFSGSVLSVAFLSSLHGLAVLSAIVAYIFLGLRFAIGTMIFCLAIYAIAITAPQPMIGGTEVTQAFLLSQSAHLITYLLINASVASVGIWVIARYSGILRELATENIALVQRQAILVEGIESGPASFAAWSPDGHLLYKNKAFESDFDLGEDVIQEGMTYREVIERYFDTDHVTVPTELRKDWIEQRMESFFSLEPIENHLSDGRWLLTNRVRAENGDILSFSTDASELKQNQLQVELILDSMSDCVLSLSRTGDITYVNKSARELLALPGDDLVGQNIEALFPDEDVHRLRELFLIAVQQRDPGEYSGWQSFRCGANDERSVSVGLRFATAEWGQSDLVVCVMRDYSLAEEAQAKQQDLYDAIQRINIGVLLINKEGVIEYFNSVLEDFFGEGVFRMHESFETASQRVADGGLAIFEGEAARDPYKTIMLSYAKVMTDDHAWFYYKIPDGRHIEAGGQTLGDGSSIWFFFDYSDQIEKDAQLVQAAKLASLGELAAGVAHEINQPLNVIKLAAANVRNSISDDSFDVGAVEGRLDKITANIDRASAIIDQLRTYTRVAEDDQSMASINACVSEAKEMLDGQLALQNIDLGVELADNDVNAAINPIKLQQVLVAMLTNARDAIVENRSDESDPRHINIKVQANGASNACICITDSGGGIRGLDAEKIFEPFVTTKPVGKGTGLGLSIAHKIVEKSGGEIGVENVPGGARFKIHLPVTRETQRAG